MTKAAGQYFDQWKGLLALWAGVLAGPVAWALSQQVGYLFATLECSYGKRLAFSPLMLLMLLLAAGGAYLSWRNWQRAREERSGQDAALKKRSRFMAFAGLLLSGFSLLLIVAEWLPVFFYRQCQR